MSFEVLLPQWRTVAYDVLPLGMTNRLHERSNRRNVVDWLDGPFLLVHIPKSAGTSIAQALGKSDPGHALLSDYPEGIRRQLQGRPAFAVWRDPVDRLVSTFKYAHQMRSEGTPTSLAFVSRFKNLDDFVQYCHSRWNTLRHHYFLRPGCEFVSAARATGCSVTIARLSSLDDDFSSFMAGIGAACPTLPHARAAKVNSSIVAEPSEQARTLIRRMYAQDYDFFG
jgi:hypothetical protein